MTFTALEQGLIQLTSLIQQMQNLVDQPRPVGLPPALLEWNEQLKKIVPLLRKNVSIIEDERRSLRALAQVSYLVNSSLELDEVLQIVMDTIIRLTGAERGFLMLRNEQEELVIRIARNWEKESIDPSEFAISRTVIYRVANEGTPLLTTNAQEDPRFSGQQSIVAYNLRSILCVPLKVRGNVTGVIYADNRIRSGLFTAKELEVLANFSNQAAVALENARLFASVRQTLDEVTALKNLMDNVFFSITSGVITADVHERVTLCNRAAGQIIGRTSPEVVGHDLEEVLAPMSAQLAPHLDEVIETDASVVGVELNPNIPERGLVDLRLSLSPLKDSQQATQGVAIVMEDLTEKKKLEAQRRLFERMVSPAVIEQLDPNSLQLGGRKAEISILFADIRGFTSFSERMSPEALVSVLNKYLAAAAEAVLDEEGTVDKFLGDAVMAWFNAPIPQPDHTLRAVKAALAIRCSLERLHQVLPPELRLGFGVGIHLGEAVLGLIGTEKKLEYTAIGDSVNTTKRLQENASAGQILISQAAYERVAGQVEVRPVEAIHAKGKREPIPVYEILGLKPPLY
jgi:PAS domain S-box-containing protein